MPKVKLPRYLQLKYNTFHVVMEIPKDVRAKFNGKPRFTKSLQTDKLATAERHKWAFIHKWKELIAGARAGDDHISTMRRDMAARGSEFPVIVEEHDGSKWEYTISEHHLDHYVSEVIEPGKDESAWDAYRVVHGEWVKLSEHVDAWKERKARIDQVAQKTLDQMAADVDQFCKKFT